MLQVWYRFVEEKFDQDSNIEMRCLKFKVRSDTILENTAPHRPDIQIA